MASGHQTQTLTLTTVTAANRHRVELTSIATEGALILGYILTCTAGTFDGRLLLTDGDPGVWGGTATTDDVIRMETDTLSLTSSTTSREVISGNPPVVDSATGCWAVFEDVGGTGLSGFSGKLVVMFSVP